MPSVLGNTPLSTELTLASSGEGVALGNIPLDTHIYPKSEVDASLGYVAAAIVEKGGTVPAAISGYGDAVRAIPSSDPEMDDVVFYNLDGTVVWSGTYLQAKTLAALPTPKSIDGLTFQEWNWTLADIAALDADAPWACVAPLYVPTDGKTHIFLHIVDGFNTKTVTFSRFMACSTSATSWSMMIDWGDGSEEETFSFSSRTPTDQPTHTYAAQGDYELTLDASVPFSIHNYNTANISLFGGSSTSSVRDPICQLVKRIYTGSMMRNQTTNRQSCLSYLANAEFIVVHKDFCTFPASSSGFNSSMTPEFSNNFEARIVAVPRGPTQTHAYLYNMTHQIVNPCLPKTIVYYDYYWMSQCYGLKRVSINKGTTRLQIGDQLNFSFLRRFDIPESVVLSKTGSARNRDWRWRWWQGARNSWNRYIGWIIPNNAASGADAGWFQQARSIEHIYIDGYLCTTSLTIKVNTFQNCVSLKDIWFVNFSIVPTIDSSTTIYGIFGVSSSTVSLLSDVTIHVPKALCDTWKAATGWSVLAANIVPYEAGECPVYGEANLAYR